MPKLFDLEAIRGYLTEVVRHYEAGAPQVSRWADELYIRCSEDWRAITLDELRTVEWLQADNGWASPNLAQNTIYRLLDRMGKDTSRVSDF